jgi:hypothetical protein
MSNLTIDEENPLQMFLYDLRAPESKRIEVSISTAEVRYVKLERIWVTEMEKEKRNLHIVGRESS